MSDIFDGSVLSGNPDNQVVTQPVQLTEQATSPQTIEQQTWYSNIKDEKLRGFAEIKQWPSVEDAVKSNYHLEQKLGKAKDAIYKPTDDNPEAWQEYYRKTGVPDKPEDYGIEGALAKDAVQWFKEAGIPKEAAVKLTEKWNKYIESQNFTSDEMFNQQVAKEKQELKQEWVGAEFDKKLSQANRVAQTFGLDADSVNAMTKSLGFKTTAKFFAKIAENLSEDVFRGHESQAKFGMSADGARAKMAELQNDPAWIKRYLAKDPQALAEMQKLIKIEANA